MGPKRPEIRKINDVNKNGDVEKAMDSEQQFGKQFNSKIGGLTSKAAEVPKKKSRPRRDDETADEYNRAAREEGWEPQ